MDDYFEFVIDDDQPDITPEEAMAAERALIRWAFKDCEPPCTPDCRWYGTRHQKCSCCRRNWNMKDNYERRADNG